MTLLQIRDRALPRTTAPIVIALVCAMAACGGRSDGLIGEVRADGSSTVFPLTTAVTDGFVRAHPGVKVVVAVSGTSGGFEKFCRGETDVQNASRPISASERAACDANGVPYVEVPVAHDGLTVIVHAGNTWAASMTVAELKALWSPDADKRVTRWKQIRADWPDEPIQLFGPGPKSGTFDHFTEVVIGVLGASRTDYTASEDDTVIVKGVSADPNAIGYVGYGYFAKSRSSLRAVAIDDQDESIGRGAIEPSPDNVRRGVYRPLSRTLFIYLNAKSLDRPEVARFVDFYLKTDEQLVYEVGGIPMSSHSYELVRKRVASRTVGTLFAEGRAAIGDLELLLSEAR